jgi:hypothetical protein
MATQVKGSRPDLLDINILPGRYRRRRVTWRSIIAWLIPALLALLLAPTTYLWLDSSAKLHQQEQDLRGAQAALEQYQPVLDQREQMAAQLEQIRAQTDQIRSAAEGATIQVLPWSDVLDMILRNSPEGIELSSIELSDYELLIGGRTRNHLLPMSMKDGLAASPPVETTAINSIEEFIPPNTTDDEAGPEDELPWYRFEISIGVGP